MSSNYAYDVFFSYKRHSLTRDWTVGVHSRLKYWIGQELGGHDVKIFIDDESIETGERWPNRLREALLRSKCMVGVWSPSYFQSDWCVSEWESFRRRERLLGMESHGLIAPLRFHDGEHFPDEAKQVQWTDVEPYTATVPAFWTSPRALQLEDVLKVLARHVARIIHNCPPFDPAWPVIDAQGFAPAKIKLARL